MNGDDEITARVKRIFLNLSVDKQQKIVDSMTSMFQKLEAEWKADPQNSGKPFSYVEAWKKFVVNQQSEIQKD